MIHPIFCFPFKLVKGQFLDVIVTGALHQMEIEPEKENFD